jgi:hypothetical protein
VYDAVQSAGLEVSEFLQAVHTLGGNADRSLVDALHKHAHIDLNARTSLAALHLGSTQTQLTARVSAARTASQTLQHRLLGYTAKQTQAKEAELVLAFVLEQLSPFERFLMRRHLNTSPGDHNPGSVYTGTYIVTWAFVVLSIAFLLFWGFWWGARQNGHTSAAWGIVLGITLAQEVLILQPLRIFLVSYLSMQTLRSHLQRIHNALHRAAMSTVKGDGAGSQVHVCQHLSAACRAAHTAAARDLVAAQILCQLGDADVAECSTNSTRSASSAVLLTLGLPALFGHIHDKLGVLVLQWWQPALFDATLLMHYYFWKGARWWIFLPYGLLLVGYVWLSWKSSNDPRDGKIYAATLEPASAPVRHQIEVGAVAMPPPAASAVPGGSSKADLPLQRAADVSAEQRESQKVTAQPAPASVTATTALEPAPSAAASQLVETPRERGPSATADAGSAPAVQSQPAAQLHIATGNQGESGDHETDAPSERLPAFPSPSAHNALDVLSQRPPVRHGQLPPLQVETHK